MQQLGMVRCEDLIFDIDKQLIEIMRKVSIEDWNRPTVFNEWKVKDIFSHLIDTMTRKLSMQRDGYFDTSLIVDIKSNSDLIRFVTRLADEWAIATKRISPGMLLKLFDMVKDEYYCYISSADPKAKALFSVSWAGENESEVWFDNARDYTEHWVHQQQIRDALKISGMYDKKYLYPLNDILIRALPVAFINIQKSEGYSLNIEILGDTSESYCLRKEENSWNLFRGSSAAPNTVIKVKDQIIWRVLTKNIQRNEKCIEVTGDESIGEVFLGATSMLI